MKTSAKKVVILAVGIVMMIALSITMLVVYNSTRDEPIEGAKSITVQITAERDSYSFEQKYDTDEEYLGDFLDKEGLVGYESSDYGRFITSAQGIEAKNEDQSWWSISVNGEMAQTGVDEIVLEDGSVYQLELKIGW